MVRCAPGGTTYPGVRLGGPSHEWSSASKGLANCTHPVSFTSVARLCRANGVMSSNVRSIFFYNAEPQIGSQTSLHLFEPRYRLMAQRTAQLPERQQQIVFLPNYHNYQCAASSSNPTRAATSLSSPRLRSNSSGPDLAGLRTAMWACWQG